MGKMDVINFGIIDNWKNLLNCDEEKIDYGGWSSLFVVILLCYV